MKKAKTILLVGAVIFAVYAVISLIINAVTYASYIDYYGLEAVLPTILEGFFSYAGWAFVLFGLAAILAKLGGEEKKSDKAKDIKIGVLDTSVAAEPATDLTEEAADTTDVVAEADEAKVDEAK